MAQSKIQTYISRHAHVGQKKSGIEIYSIGKVKVKKINKTEDHAEFKVVDNNQTHLVMLVNYTNRIFADIVTTCTCSYDNGGICKHRVAALLYLDNFLKGISPPSPAQKDVTKMKTKSSTHNTSAWFSLGNIANLTVQQIKANTPTTNQDIWGLKVADAELLKNSIQYTVVNGGYWNASENKVELRLNNENLQVQCNCSTRVKYLCKHQLYIFAHAVDLHKLRKALNLDLSHMHQLLAENYGIDKQEVSAYFKPVLTQYGEVSFKPHDKGVGLLPIKEELFEQEEKRIMSLFFIENEQKENLFVKEETKIEKTQHGVVLCYEDIGFVHFEMVRGKPSKKNDDIVYMEPFNEYEANKYPKEVRNLFYDLDNFNTTNFRSKSIAATFFNYFTHLVDTLQKVKGTRFLYYNKEQGEHFSKSEIQPTAIADSMAKLSLHFEETDALVTFDMRVLINGKKYKVTSKLLNLSFLGLVIHNNIIYPFSSAEECHVYYQLVDSPSFSIMKSKAELLIKNFAERLSDKIDIDYSGLKSFHLKKEKKPISKRKMYISEAGNIIVFRPVVEYDNQKEISLLDSTKLVEVKDQNILIKERDDKAEEEYLNAFKDLHEDFSTQHNVDFFHLSMEKFMEKGWFFNAFEKLQKMDAEVLGLNKLKKFNYSPHKAKIATQVSSGQDWFEVNVELAFGNEKVSLREVQKAIRKGENFVRLGDGSLGLLPEEWLKKMERYLRAGQISKNELKISKLKFSVVDELFEDIDNTDILIELSEKRAKLEDFENIKSIKVSPKIKAELRDYQKEGLNWLNFLAEFKWGGILADDMGLGKTIQILSFLQDRAGKSKKANLVVIPTTLLFNWQHEINKFTTDLKVLIHYGSDRKKEHKHFSQYDIIITTYGMLINDAKILSKYTFNHIILDESQAIKNPESQRYKAACLLKGESRIALTGTPIENNTFDLFAQMNFLNPGFLGTPTQFRENYSTPIDRDRNPERAEELQRIIKPFVLRRTKEQVAKELPSKTEDVLMCEMSDEQRKVYDAFRNKYRDKLLNKIEEDGLGKSKMYVLEGLTKLRQICDSPELLNDEESYGTASVKIDELVSHITDKTGGHKILVFSQFVKMLGLIKAKLNAQKISYEYLDGQSSQKQREASVDHFQTDESCRVFLISLKAGGTGLNLTAADYVYLVDPWWNPAVENQAIDRSYRIGQDKKVFAYRMICKGTVEEKILKYQEQKRAVAEDIILTEDSFMKKLDKADIQDLFA